jgi:hypothetical protein
MLVKQLIEYEDGRVEAEDEGDEDAGDIMSASFIVFLMKAQRRE